MPRPFPAPIPCCTHTEGAVGRGNPAQGEKLVHVAVLHDGVDYDGHVVVLHADPHWAVDIGVGGASS